ncbi:unnamed protein product [Arabidopsis thaliana]|uniref:Uncharacterized protein n=1 Tax=Arabidopsis thaliana TaxID=3702 RepID=A0A5S9XTR1_ARATH|nr:unnamed protein product [Arabidopsis thaliana]
MDQRNFIRLEIVVAKSRFAKTRSMICYGDDSIINAWSDPWKQLERNKNLIVLAEEDVKEKEAIKSSKKQQKKPYVFGDDGQRIRQSVKAHAEYL